MKKGTLSNILLVLMLVVGLSLLLYPSFSDWWNDMHQTKAIANYASVVSELKEEDFSHIWESAESYNAGLNLRSNSYTLTEEQKNRYENELNVAGNGVMGYIEIPDIDVFIPLYHGTSEAVLQVAIGHIEWSSLPVGGESTHCVVSGHRGLPSARLFTDLDKMGVGDVFMINVLNQVLTYQVDQIKIVLPHETEDLLVVEGEDYCTLVTCTPYGVNSHRMLVRGTRINNLEEAKVIRVTADAVRIEPILVAPALAAPILLILLIALMLPKPKKKRRNDM
ncbi:MAG: class C sortase [Oscillospiraceae bacterium]|nr:class C sortase [Oscillospiraceae bacterium]